MWGVGQLNHEIAYSNITECFVSKESVITRAWLSIAVSADWQTRARFKFKGFPLACQHRSWRRVSAIDDLDSTWYCFQISGYCSISAPNMSLTWIWVGAYERYWIIYERHWIRRDLWRAVSCYVFEEVRTKATDAIPNRKEIHYGKYQNVSSKRYGGVSPNCTLAFGKWTLNAFNAQFIQSLRHDRFLLKQCGQEVYRILSCGRLLHQLYTWYLPWNFCRPLYVCYLSSDSRLHIGVKIEWWYTLSDKIFDTKLKFRQFCPTNFFPIRYAVNISNTILWITYENIISIISILAWA